MSELESESPCTGTPGRDRLTDSDCRGLDAIPGCGAGASCGGANIPLWAVCVDSPTGGGGGGGGNSRDDWCSEEGGGPVWMEGVGVE